MKPLFVIMVTYRRCEYLMRTVESLFASVPEGTMLAIVNNGDDDETRDYLSKLTAPSAVTLTVLDTGDNQGWGAGMNEGLWLFREWKDYEYVLESNNDVIYEPDWFEKAKEIMSHYPGIGILGLWKHPYHGVRQTFANVIIKDDMPATAWFMRSKDLQQFLPFPEKGPCKTRGGNGEDVTFRERVQNKFLRWIGAPIDDLAHHIDGYDTDDLGKENSVYI